MPKLSYLNTTHMAGNYENKSRSKKIGEKNVFYNPHDNFK